MALLKLFTNRTQLRRQMLLVISGCLLLGGCRVDMHVQPKMKPLRQSDFFADKRGSRPLPVGTIARGQLRADSYFYSGLINGNPGDQFPMPVTKAVLERGQERFNIYCSPCHSYVGDGNGMIYQRGLRRPVSFHSPSLINSPVGHFVDVMTNGFGAMPDYAAQIRPTDRWAIAAYVRALQLSQKATPAAVPAGQTLSEVENPISQTPGAGSAAPENGENK